MKHCQHCDRDFATPSSLKRHFIAKHTEYTSALVRHEHQCTICDTRFARNETLLRHIRSKHTRELMTRCQFCLDNFRDDYFDRHESRCGRKYWAKVCRYANFTKEIHDGQSKNIDGRSAARHNLFLNDIRPVCATGDSLRVMHEIGIDMRLASKAFHHRFLHCCETRDVGSCLEAITTSFLHNIPVELQTLDFLDVLENDQFRDLLVLARSIGQYVRGERGINDTDLSGYTIMDKACHAGAADLIEPLFWRGAGFNKITLFFAIESRNFDTVRFCLALGADPNDCLSYRNDRHNPLTLASASSETSHIVAILLEYGATVFVRDNYGETPLHSAARRADVDLIRVLLAKDSSTEFLDATNEEGNRALDVAFESMDSGTTEDQVLELVSALLDAGADAIGIDFGNSGLTLARAARYECKAIVRLLLKREPERPRKTAWLNEALIKAFYKEAEHAVRILIEAGVSLDDDMVSYGVMSSLGMRSAELFLELGGRVDDHTIDCLFSAARDQRVSGETQTNFGWLDAGAKCKLLELYLPDDERLRNVLRQPNRYEALPI